MKKILSLTLAIIMIFTFAVGCGEKATVKETIEGNFRTYSEMSDGTWMCEDHIYKYRLEISGRLPNAAMDTTYVYLSNLEDISFEQAWKASGLSSDSADYFDPEEAVLVEMLLEGEGTEPTGQEDPAEPDDDPYTFQTKVAGAYQYEIFGEEIIDTWFNMVDAVMAGEDTFECPDQDTYDCVMANFRERYFPVLEELIYFDYDHPVEDGIGHIQYMKSKEETAQEIKDFMKLVEDLLNKSMKRSWSDLENALSLYSYFNANYEYDYDTYYALFDDYVNGINTYRFMQSGIGICNQISQAYSYLLMQAGIDATTMMGTSKFSGESHAWSYVRFNGRNYHIDPTYSLSTTGDLSFFMMDDEKRAEEYPPKDYYICASYTEDHKHPDYVADDDSFSPIWEGTLDHFDHDTHTLYYSVMDDKGDYITKEFDYEGY